MHSLLIELQNRMEHNFFGAASPDLLDILETNEQNSAVSVSFWKLRYHV